MEKLKQKLSQISGGKILDVGSGRGEFIHTLKENLQDYTEIIGIDHIERSVNFCNEQFKEEKIHFMKMSGEKIEFSDETFDMVCISNTLHHLPNQDIILQEMKRVLKPNGFLVINEMICDNQTDEQLSHVKVHHFAAKIDSLIGNYHDETFTRNRIMKIVDSLNLSNLDNFDYRYIYDDPKDEELVKHLVDACGNIIERIREQDQYDELKHESNKICEWVKNYGFQPATQLIIIGKK